MKNWKLTSLDNNMDFKDVTYLRIEHYSNHPEVKAAADILVEKYAETKQFVKSRPKELNFSSSKHFAICH